MENNFYSCLQSKLIYEEKMSRIQAAITAADIMNYYDAAVRNAILEWVEGKDVSSFEMDGAAVQDYIEEIGCSVFQALSMMNAVHVKPDSFQHAVLVLWGDMIQ